MLQQFVANERIPNVEFVPTLPREIAQQRIASADVGVVSALPGLYEVAYPSKMMSYLLSGLPVLTLAEESSSISEFLRVHDLGVTASPSDESKAADTIVDLVRRLENGEYDRSRIVRRSAELFSRSAYFASYGRVMEKCTTTQNACRSSTSLELAMQHI